MKYLFIFIFLLIAIGCAGKLIKFDQYSVAMNLEVEADSSIFIGEDDEFRLKNRLFTHSDISA